MPRVGRHVQATIPGAEALPTTGQNRILVSKSNAPSGESNPPSDEGAAGCQDSEEAAAEVLLGLASCDSGVGPVEVRLLSSSIA